MAEFSGSAGLCARDILAAVDEISPFESQESWDNSGLLLDSKGSCERLIVALDIDYELAQAVEANSCVLVHHPLIFRGLKTLASGHEARILLTLAAKNCALIAAHTNFDKSHLNKYFCEQILGLKISKTEGFFAFCENNFSSLKELGEFIKKRLNLGYLRVVDAGEFCRDLPLAICTGAGASMSEEIYGQAAVFLTGDIKYHEALAAKLNGLNMADITHYTSEICFGECARWALKDLPIFVRVGAFLNPFSDF